MIEYQNFKYWKETIKRVEKEIIKTLEMTRDK